MIETTDALQSAASIIARSVPQPAPIGPGPANDNRVPGRLLNFKPNQPPQPEGGQWQWNNGWKWVRLGSGVGTFLTALFWPGNHPNPWMSENWVPEGLSYDDPVVEDLHRTANDAVKNGSDPAEVGVWLKEELERYADVVGETAPIPPEADCVQQCAPQIRLREDENDDDENCPWIVICFMPSANVQPYNAVEFARQLHGQSQALQGIDPSTYLGRRAKVIADQTTEIERKKPSAKRAYNDIWRVYKRANPSYPSDGSIAALHRLDIIAGGDATDFERIGPSRENSLIGSQWSQANGVSGGDRLRRLDAHATELQRRGCSRMNASLQVCPGRGTDTQGNIL